MKVEVYESEDGFDVLRGEWNALLRRSLTDTVFLTWEWQTLWWRAYHPGELFIVALRDDADTLVGIAPWFIDTTSPDERVLRGIGCVDVTDYVDVIADSAHFDAAMTAFAGVARERCAGYTRINLCNLREISPTLSALRAAFEAAGFGTEVREQEVCPVIPLNRTFMDYVESLDKKNRHELRRKLRLAEGMETLVVRIVSSESELPVASEQFLALMAESSEEKATFLQNAQHVAFFKSLLPAMLENGWLQLAFLDYDGQPTAVYANFIYNGRVMVYNSGLSLSHGQLGPGIILLGNLIRMACEAGYSAFDFLRGNEEYKFRMGGIAEPIYMLRARME